MANKLHACPVCGRKYCDLNDLARCIGVHAKDQTTQAEEAEKKQKRIEELRNKNAALIKQIQDNCRELRSLGIKVNVSYIEANMSTTNENKTNKKISNVDNSQIKKDLTTPTDEDRAFAEKLNKEIDKAAKDVDKMLRHIFGF